MGVYAWLAPCFAFSGTWVAESHPILSDRLMLMALVMAVLAVGRVLEKR